MSHLKRILETQIQNVAKENEEASQFNIKELELESKSSKNGTSVAKSRYIVKTNVRVSRARSQTTRWDSSEKEIYFYASNGAYIPKLRNTSSNWKERTVSPLSKTQDF